MLKIIPVINNKGGVGKTTTTINLAAGLARTRGRVLLVDMDSQASASLALGVPRTQLRPSIAHALYNEAHIREAIRPTAIPNLDLVPGSLDLADADLCLSDQPLRERILKQVLDEIRDDYDAILLDCPPSTSLLSVNILVAADAFIIPLRPSYLALEGLVSLGEVVTQVRVTLGRVAPVLGVLLTLVDPNNESAREVEQQIRHHYGTKVFTTVIRSDAALEDAAGAGQPIFDYAPQSQGAQDYEALLAEVNNRIDRYNLLYGRLHNPATMSTSELVQTPPAVR